MLRVGDALLIFLILLSLYVAYNDHSGCTCKTDICYMGFDLIICPKCGNVFCSKSTHKTKLEISDNEKFNKLEYKSYVTCPKCEYHDRYLRFEQLTEDRLKKITRT